MKAIKGEQAPNLSVSEWIQGDSTNIDQERGHIVLVDIFQVNCPGCFLYAIPEAISIYKKYKEHGVRVLGMATAFEDFDKNTLDNLKLLAKSGEVIGETKNALSIRGQLLESEKLAYKIPFPLAMDRLIKASAQVTQEQIMGVIREQVPQFASQPETIKNQIIRQVKVYLESKEYTAETFETYSLKGTPSSILVDREGILQTISFGQTGNIESMIQKLL